MPFSRDTRAVVYQRAKMVLDKRPFGTQKNVYEEGYEWMHHSVAPRPHATEQFRITIGGPDCLKPYSASVLNISAMSFGALSPNAIRALNAGAKRGDFAHDTGEGGVSPYHQEMGGDLIWEVGSGYFGCRTRDGNFDPDAFAKLAVNDQIKMVELKISQGAKPGHGGVLPAAKVSEEISRIRGVAMGEDCISPAYHKAFSTPIEMMEFIDKMRRLSGGKPAGFKLCIGHPWEFLAICKAMLQTGIYPDFIVIDGNEGGTGAAPLEFMDHLGMPMREGVNFVHNALIGIGARDRIKIGASGKIATAFDIARAMALGADWCNSARGFMFALGCIQSLSCHTDRCPTGVTTQDPHAQSRAGRAAEDRSRLQLSRGDVACAGGADCGSRARSSAGYSPDPFLASRLQYRRPVLHADVSGAASTTSCSMAPATSAFAMHGRWRKRARSCRRPWNVRPRFSRRGAERAQSLRYQGRCAARLAELGARMPSELAVQSA